MLKIENISKSFGRKRALDDVSFEVGDGELFGLIGPDGAGKTTLFRIAATLILPDTGRAVIDGRDVRSDFEFVRSHIGYMPGRFSLYQDLSVRENLEFFATVMNTSIDKNRYLIDDIYRQLEPFEKRRAGALSGGMKQKLALCCALIHKPLLLLLDEPTTGVDAVSRREFWSMLKKLKSFGISILVSTPYMDESILCDRVALIQEGKILEVDTPQNIVSGFSKAVFQIKGQGLYSALPFFRKLKSVSSAYPFGDSLHVYTENESDFQSEIKTKSPAEGLVIQKISPGIEDVFMNLMSQHST